MTSDADLLQSVVGQTIVSLKFEDRGHGPCLVMTVRNGNGVESCLYLTATVTVGSTSLPLPPRVKSKSVEF